MSLYCRQELNVRLTANLLLAFCAWHPPCRPYIARYFSASVRLPSDWMQIADLVMTFPGVAGGSLPAALRKAMVDKFEEFDEYQLAKYNRERKGIMVRETTNVITYTSEISLNLSSFMSTGFLRRVFGKGVGRGEGGGQSMG